MAHIVLVESTLTAGFGLVHVAAARGHQVTIMVHSVEPYLLSTGADEALGKAFEVRTGVPTADEEGLLKALTELNEELPVDGVIALSDGNLLPAIRAAARLGVPTESVETIGRLRDKFAMRTALREAKVPQPDFRRATTPNEAVAAAVEIGWPVVLKPVDGFSSKHVGVAETPEEARALAETIVTGRAFGRGVIGSGQILVEKFVPGPLVSCEMVTVKGQHRLYGCVDRLISESASHIEMGGCFPADLPQSLTDEAVRVCSAALDAVGLANSFSHTEMILSPDGPQIVEVNGRMVGGPVPTMMNGVLAHSIYEDLIDMAIGANPRPPVINGAGCIRAITADTTGVLRGIDAEEARAVGGVSHIILNKEAGWPVRPPQENEDRLGFVIATGPDVAAAREAAETAHAKVRVLLEPEAGTAASTV